MVDKFNMNSNLKNSAYKFAMQMLEFKSIAYVKRSATEVTEQCRGSTVCRGVPFVMAPDQSSELPFEFCGIVKASLLCSSRQLSESNYEQATPRRWLQ